MKLPIAADSVKGFLDPAEGAALYAAARSVAALGPCLEIGSYCGRSALYLGTACRDGAGHVFTVDHHSGSEEHQPGWDFHDPALWDPEANAVDTLPVLRDTLRRAGLEDVVTPIVGRAEIVARYWRTPLSLVFIDGSHSGEAAHRDYDLWHPHVMQAGLLVIHDVFPDPADGGRPPFEIYVRALDSGRFEQGGLVKSLRILKRI